MVIGLKLLVGDRPQPHRRKILVMPTWTDNRGSGAALNKLASTRFPASAALMELACCLKRMSTQALVEWAPRETSREADELANCDFHQFDPSRRISVGTGTLRISLTRHSRWKNQRDETPREGRLRAKDHARERENKEAKARRQNQSDGSMVPEESPVNKSSTRPVRKKVQNRL